MVFWPSGLLAIRPSDHPAIWPSGHPAFWLSGHPDFWPSDHPVIRPSGHPTIRSSDHPVIQPSGHPTIRSSNHPVIHPTNPVIGSSNHPVFCSGLLSRCLKNVLIGIFLAYLIVGYTNLKFLTSSLGGRILIERHHQKPINSWIVRAFHRNHLGLISK